jgi:hypothetical protein
MWHKLLAEDQAQLDYYREITKRMPGAVLRRRGVIDYQKRRVFHSSLR